MSAEERAARIAAAELELASMRARLDADGSARWARLLALAGELISNARLETQ